MDIVEVDQLTKKYGDLTAVDQISFSVHEGEIFGFLGPNGAGKTTTINVLLDTTFTTSSTDLRIYLSTEPSTVCKRTSVKRRRKSFWNNLGLQKPEVDSELKLQRDNDLSYNPLH